MDEVHLAENFKEELTCSVCMDYFRHPVTLSCGHNFCRICLLRSWGEDDRPCPCPLCRRPFHMRDIELNHRLGKLASIGRSLRPYFLQIKEEKVTCEKHEEEKTLFCKKDKSFLCVYCFQSQEHEDHMVHNVKEAAEDSRVKLQKTLDLLQKKVVTVQNIVTEEREKEKTWKEKIQIWRESLAAEYGAFHKLLEKEEKVHFHTMNKQESDNLKIVRQSVITVSQQLHSLREVILDMEQCSWKTSSQLLKVVGGTLNRCEFLLGHRPEVITTSGIMFQKTIMWEMLKSFKVTLTLDPKNISPYLILSDDLRTVIRRSNQQNTPFSTNQDENNFILGDQIFTTGIHYWEVEVGDSRQWALGVCRKSMRRTGDLFFHFDKLIFLSSVRTENGYAITTTPHYFEHLIPFPILWVGILLDCNEETISFYDALEKCLIYHFPHFHFSGPLQPFFSPSPPTGEENGTPMTIRA